MECKKCKKIIDDGDIFCRYCGRKQIAEKRRTKNQNGFGAIEKLSGNRRKPYAVRVTDGIVEGRQLRRYISYHETLAEAKKALAMEQVNPTPPKADLTFTEIYEEWKQTPAFRNISKQTQDNYTAAYKHLSPLCNMKFKELRTGNFQALIDNLTSVTGKPLSKSSKHKVKIFIGLLYKYAMENDIVNKNYAQFIKLEREEKKEKTVFTADEIAILENNIAENGADIVLILIYTGMRINELLTLKKSDIDLKSRTITGGLKTDAGKNRTIPIHDKIYDYVVKHYFNGHDDLFVREDGTPLKDNHFRKYIYYPLLDKLGIERRTIHSTRHTCASILAENGADTLAIKNILGHTNYGFTADTYTHADIEYLKKEMAKAK